MTSNTAQRQPASTGDLRELTAAELDEVGGGCVLLVAVAILYGCAAVAGYCTAKMAME